jgi:hypothetical protein
MNYQLGIILGYKISFPWRCSTKAIDQLKPETTYVTGFCEDEDDGRLCLEPAFLSRLLLGRKDLRFTFK